MPKDFRVIEYLQMNLLSQAFDPMGLVKFLVSKNE